MTYVVNPELIQVLSEIRDELKENRKELKQIHHEPCDYYQFGNKIEAENFDYQRLLNAGIRIPKMIDIDFDNEVIVKEYVEGKTID